MGFNTTVVVCNDFIHDIEQNPGEFAKGLADGIGAYTYKQRPIYIGFGANVIETHHADGNAVVSVGGNCGHVLGHVLGSNREDNETKLSFIKQLAEQHGYRLVKKRKVSR